MPLLIFTDLDATLLGHEDYRYEPALPLIRELTAAGTEIILSTSKTLPEVRTWQQRLGLTSPFMVENGSAVYFPESLPPGELSRVEDGRLSQTADGMELRLGVPLAELQSVLAPFEGRITDLTRCSVDEAIALTGLTRTDAVAAQDRRFSVPMVPVDAQTEAEIVHAAGAAGLSCTRGGRFLHLQGACSKGLALARVRDLLDECLQTHHSTIALGDNQNDLAMLEAADIAVVMQTDSGYRISPDHPRVIRTRQVAPEGWVEGVGTALAVLK